MVRRDHLVRADVADDMKCLLSLHSTHQDLRLYFTRFTQEDLWKKGALQGNTGIKYTTDMSTCDVITSIAIFHVG